jgi:tetratricopeptide (TPR) repeat protein
MDHEVDLMRAPFAAYRGTEPYTFVCYAHQDSDLVYPELSWLNDQGFHIWYDEGISPGTVWRDELAEAIEGASLFLLYVSPASVTSSNCNREVSFAVDQDLSLLAVYLQPTELPRGLRLAILDRQALMREQLAPDEYRRRLAAAMQRLVDPTSKDATFVVPNARTTNARIHIAVAASDPAERRDADLSSAITRYLSWHGGIYRSHDIRGAGSRDVAFRIDVATLVDGDATISSWQVARADTREVIWANQSREPTVTFTRKLTRIAESIGEGALSAIAADEQRRIAGRGIAELGYAQLMVKADQLNYMDRDQVAERFQALKRAIELEPTTGIAHAALAQLLSWQILNRVSDDAERDRTTLLEEARLALKLSSDDPFVLLSVGTAYCRIEQYAKGLSLIQRASDLAPTIGAKDHLARSLCFAGQPEKAIPLFEAILESMPAGHTFPYVRLSIALTQAGRLDDAIGYSSQGIVHFPEDYYSWVMHANLLAQLKRPAEAVEALAEVRRLLPKLRLDALISGTEAAYGRTPEQRGWLTGGLRILQEGESRA